MDDYFKPKINLDNDLGFRPRVDFTVNIPHSDITASITDNGGVKHVLRSITDDCGTTTAYLNDGSFITHFNN